MKHTTRKNLVAQHAFKISMIHKVLRFASHITFCCVLHRCGNLDIHCWKLCVHTDFNLCQFPWGKATWQLSVVFPVLWGVIAIIPGEISLSQRRDPPWHDFNPLSNCRTSIGTAAQENWCDEGKQGDGHLQYNHSERGILGVVMILPQVHLRKPCYDFTFL